MIFYALLTYGKKPTGSIAKHPAAQSQLRFYQAFVSHHGIQNAQSVYDYSRKINDLNSVPNLRKLLKALKNKQGGKVYIDDVARLLKGCELHWRVGFLEELREHGAHIHSLKHQKTLEEFSGAMLKNLVQFPEKSKHPAKQARPKCTLEARRSSAEARSSNAVRHARPLADLRQELISRSGRATLEEIADEAAVRGLKTSKGKNWTPQNVARALKLVDKDGCDV
jgi:hypothetical protein